MEEAVINTPLGWAKIEGDMNGISSVSILDDTSVSSSEIPEELEEAVYQLREYFEGSRQHFDLELNPQGTEFQLRVWKELKTIPYGKQISLSLIHI